MFGRMSEYLVRTMSALRTSGRSYVLYSTLGFGGVALLSRAFSSSSSTDITQTDRYACCSVGGARERYCAEHSTQQSAQLQQVEEETRKMLKMDFMLSGALNGQFLKMLVQLTQSKRILEIGTYTGFSALAMSEGISLETKQTHKKDTKNEVPDFGDRNTEGPNPIEIVCIDSFVDEPKSKDIFLKVVERSPLRHQFRLIEDSAIWALDRLEREEVPPFDFVFIDADKESQIAYFERLMAPPRRLLSDRALIVVDNTLWYSKVLPKKDGGSGDRDSGDCDSTTAEIRKFNEHVARDSRVEVVMLPVRDGLTLIRPKPRAQA